MSEQTEKFVAIGIGLALVVGIVAWRSMSPAAPAADGAAGQGGFTATVLHEKEAPEGYRGELFFRLKTVDGLAAEKLAELELRDTRAELEKAVASGEDTAPVRNKEMRLGANVKLLGPMEDVPDAGTARVVATLYLVHAGKFPAAHVGKKHQNVCTVVEVDPSGDAFAGGLRVGDVWVQVDATDLLASKLEDPCKDLTVASKATAVGAEVKFVVFRAGARTELVVHKGSDRLKFTAIPVPVLDADKL